MTSRPTQDLDFFAAPGGNIVAARDTFEAVARDRDWTVRRIRDSETFCRLLVSGTQELIVDLAIDSPPGMQPVVSVAGPTFAHEELAGRKVIALFDRAEARDFVDVYTLAGQFSKELLLKLAAQVDPGFNHRIYAEMMSTLGRFADDDLPIAPAYVSELRVFFAEWEVQLRGPQ